MLSDRLTQPLKSLAVVDKAVYQNCLVAMRPKTHKKELPSSHEVKNYIQKQFVERIDALKEAFKERQPLLNGKM